MLDIVSNTVQGQPLLTMECILQRLLEKTVEPFVPSAFIFVTIRKELLKTTNAMAVQFAII